MLSVWQKNFRQIIFYSTFYKKSNLKIHKMNKNSILISKIQYPNGPFHPLMLAIIHLSFDENYHNGNFNFRRVKRRKKNSF
jgi:hypothetical protein